ncbi:hypothetical protein DV515_00007153 [Chloebia gouldiae]|uniref:Uncharacterized protein n=1 Tax=Chloebia gouldiae TaxID=44316 RepID=A0A3L8SIQ1_CHLGU|nr:hypothetical protein DV515_00007153 [Chloebia gouldiae]
MWWLSVKAPVPAIGHISPTEAVMWLSRESVQELMCLCSELLLLGPFPGKGSAKGPLPRVRGREGGLEAVESCQQCSSST